MEQASMSQGITARAFVLGNPDLLERILLSCSIATILHSQQVSRVWKVIVASSVPLQQALFFRPEPQQTNPIGSTRWKSNPLLEAAFPAWFDEIRHRHHMPGIEAFDEMDWTDERRQAFTRAEASWRKMLPIQPAVSVLEVKNFSHGKMMDGLSNDVAYLDGGLRMGTLYDLAEGHVARHRVSSFAVIWPREEEVVHEHVSVGYIEDEEDQGRKQQSPPPPPSPPPRPAPIKTTVRADSLVSDGPISPPLPSPWVIGSLVFTRVEEEEEEEDSSEPLQQQRDDSDLSDDADSLCGDRNYGQHATLILAHVQQCYPGHLPSERKYKSQGQEPIAIEAGKYRFRQHGGVWEDLTS
ncbi:uncharacterized protein J3D65DRAFT_611149 [Phyllosticta citribraziliensis]|uniref:F-box domain-containing protein n=1 Tax=Phyllosticta citribraziliensis TaxID=989973 RepID=A0ABR1MAJ9_9PEZI